MTTHEVTNQPPPLRDYDLFASDEALRACAARELDGSAAARLSAYGRVAGSELLELGFLAERHRPELQSHDRFGHRIDEVAYAPAYHRAMQLAIGAGLHSLPWTERSSDAHVLRAALCYLHAQVEPGSYCPISMTFSALAALRLEPELAALWEPRLLSAEYDPRSIPAERKRGALVGMGMTEKQGGSDVRSNTTRARALGGGEYELVGHKWFFSAPMSDAFLVLAQAERGLSCFLLPRWRPDGSRNALRLQRLKDKLGNRSNASGEVEFEGAWAQRVGEEGRGVQAILEMVMLTRLDCAIASAALMRQALAQAAHHAAHRAAFGRMLVEHALMQNVLADLALESEAALVLALRLARAVGEAPGDPRERAFARIATPIAKYWICKRAAGAVAEALECLGGGGYVEESILPRLFRESPLASIWEGCGNVQCLDVLRALAREPETRDALRTELGRARGGDRRLDAEVGALEAELSGAAQEEVSARRLVERLALALQATLLVRAGDTRVSDAFCSRLSPGRGLAFGTLPPGTDVRALAERARPRIGA
jgi:putative acyl-CoA dehydrogenase